MLQLLEISTSFDAA
jgi:hypothetical protein